MNSQLLVDTLTIRQSELDFYSFSLNAIILAASALYMGALTIWGNYFIPIYPDTIVARILYNVSIIIALNMQFLILIPAVFTVIMAPGLALRGPAGSMDVAVEGMRDITWKLAQIMIGSLAMLQFSLSAFCWTQEGIFEFYSSVLADISFTIGLALAAIYGYTIYEKLKFDVNESLAPALAQAAVKFAEDAGLGQHMPGGPSARGPPVPAASNYTPGPDPSLAPRQEKPKGFWRAIMDGSA